MNSFLKYTFFLPENMRRLLIHSPLLIRLKSEIKEIYVYAVKEKIQSYR